MTPAHHDILCVTSDRTKGGIQKALCDYADVLASEFKTGFAALSPENSFTAWLSEYYPHCTHIPLSPIGTSVMRHLPVLTPSCVGKGQSARIALVHNGFACAAAQKLADRVIGICHNDKPHQFGFADTLVCLTPAGFENAKQSGWSEDQLYCLPHFYTCQHQRPVDKLASSVFRISAAGRFVEKKNFSFLIRLAAKLQAQRPGICVTLAGDGPLRETLQSEAAATGAQITFSGWMDMNKLASQTDLFIVPSHDEPFGYVLAEMMDAGVAVMATPTHGAEYILDKGAVAPIIDDADDASWVDQITELAEHKNRCNQIAKQGFARIRQPLFSRSHFSHRLIALLTE